MTQEKLSEYGHSFQIKVLYSLLNDRKFLQNISEIITPDYFELPAHKWIVETILKYFDKYNTYPTMEVLKVEMLKIKKSNDILFAAVKEELRQAYYITEEDIEYVNNEFFNFCKNQKLKDALFKSVELLNAGDYDDIPKLMSDAIRVGEINNAGIDCEKDIETIFREEDRQVVPFPWPIFNKHTQGGYGSGDLVLIFGNPKGGKSWAAVAMGAFAAMQGYDVVHYTLELTEDYVGKRYYANWTGIPVDNLRGKRKEVEEFMKTVPGKVIIKGYPVKKASLKTIESHLRYLKNTKGIVPRLVIIDYLDLLRSNKRKDRKEEVDDIYTEAKGLAGELGIPIISPSQANRTAANSKIIEGNHAAGSYDKIMIADILISLARSRKQKRNGTGFWYIMGNRYGTDGIVFDSTINTSNGRIIISTEEIDLDEDGEEDIDDELKSKMKKKLINIEE